MMEQNTTNKPLRRVGTLTLGVCLIAAGSYINYYNNERIQEKTKWMPPTKFREASMCT